MILNFTSIFLDSGQDTRKAQKTGFFTEILFCSVLFQSLSVHGSLIYHAVYKIAPRLRNVTSAVGEV